MLFQSSIALGFALQTEKKHVLLSGFLFLKLVIWLGYTSQCFPLIGGHRQRLKDSGGLPYPTMLLLTVINRCPVHGGDDNRRGQGDVLQHPDNLKDDRHFLQSQVAICNRITEFKLCFAFSRR